MIQRHGDYLSVCVGIKNNTAQGRRCAVSTTLLRCPESGEYEEAQKIFSSLRDFKDSADRKALCRDALKNEEY